MDLQTNPFSALSFIAAPAVLTNSCSILILSTSNRLARAVDLARSIMTEMDRAGAVDNPYAPAQLRELDAAQRRMLMLIRALRAFYISLGGFAVAALLSLIGAAMASSVSRGAVLTVEVVAIGVGIMAVMALVRGAVLLLRETRIAVKIMEERVLRVQAKFAAGHPPGLGEAAW